jgi:hypothetical protein
VRYYQIKNDVKARYDSEDHELDGEVVGELDDIDIL